MGIFDKNKTEVTNQDITENQNVNVQDVDGLTIAGNEGGSITVYSTDQNAFDNASRLAADAVSFAEAIAGDSLRLSLESSNLVATAGQRAQENVVDIAGGAISEIGNSQRNALAFGEQSLAAVADNARDFGVELSNNSRDFAAALRGFASDAADNATDLFERALSFVGASAKASQDSLGSTVTALNTIAREQSKSTDERVAEVSGNALKYTLLAVVGLAVAAVAYGALKK